MDRELTDNLVNSTAPAVNMIDHETEKALLAICLRGNNDALNTVLGKGITSHSFGDDRNMLIFEAISSIYLNNGDIDRFNVSSELERSGTINKAGGVQYVFDVADTAAIISNLNSYIETILEKHRLRQITKILDEMQRDAKSGRSAPNSIIDYGIDRFTGLREDPEGVGFESIGAILKNNLREMHDSMSGKNRDKTVKTGFRGLDYMLGGLKPGTLNILAARPGMGKTALVINIATNVASFKNNTYVDIFSLEMSKSEIGNRILASRTNVTTKEITRASITPEKEQELIRAYKDLAALNIEIDDNSSVTPALMMSKCKELKSKGKLGLIIVDYLQLMTGSDERKNSSRQQEISDISRSLKILAKEMNVPIIALSQLSRGAEQRGGDDGDHTPKLSDLRDSGAIEQDADSVWFIDRPDYYKKKDEELPQIQDARIIVAKNRHGETGVVKLKWWGAKTLFFEEDRKQDPIDPATTGASSAYTRTTTPGASASDYQFGEAEEPTPPPVDDSMMPPSAEDMVPPPMDDVPFDTNTGSVEDGGNNSANDEFFENSSSDFPEGFI